MSQPKEARGTGKFDTIIQGRKFTAEFLKSLQNNKVFKVRLSGDAEDDAKNPPQPELVALLRTTCLDAYISAYSANETMLTKNNYRHRRQLQDKSVAKWNELLALIELAKPIFHLPTKRVEYWTKEIVYTRNLTQKWKESNYSKYRKM